MFNFVLSNTKFREELSGGTRVIACGWKDRRPDVTKLTAAVRSSANAPKNIFPFCWLSNPLPLESNCFFNCCRNFIDVMQETGSAHVKHNASVKEHDSFYYIKCHFRGTCFDSLWVVFRPSKVVFLERRSAARYRALAIIIPGREKFSWNLSF